MAKKTDKQLTERVLTCSSCGVLSCRTNDSDKFPEFCLTKNVDQRLLKEAVKGYENDENRRLAETATILEKDFYGRMCRVEETIEFIRRMKYQKVGIASCVGLMHEASIFYRILKDQEINSFTVGCKIGAVDKTVLGVPPEKKLNGGCGHESMCNPIMQAKKLAQEKTELNIVMGLCVGHDSLFIKHSKAPVTVMVVKDRVLGHNPVAALYTAFGMYSRFKKKS